MQIMSDTRKCPMFVWLRLVLALTMIPVGPMGQVAAESDFEENQIVVGDMVSVKAKGVIKVSISDPDIADISEARADEVSVVGKKVGDAVLFIWDSEGKKTTVIHVIAEDLTLLRAKIESLLDSAGISEIKVRENPQQGVVVVSGDLPDNKKVLLEKVLEPFGKNFINLTKPAVAEDMIQIDMQVTELSTTLSKALGVDWTTGDNTLDPTTGALKSTDSGGFSQYGLEVMPSQSGGLDMFKIGKFYRSSNGALIAKINALIQQGKAHVLSKPRLVVMSGKEATFNVGGEVPVRSSTTTGTTGTTTNAVSFKQYGINLIIMPTIREGKIDLVMNLEISDLDRANYNGTDVAFVTRTATTNLFLDDHQPIVLAGLIKKNTSENKNRVPLLGSIPVIGMLFRSKKTPTPDSDTEIVISLVPTIISTGKNGRKSFQPQNAASLNVPVIPRYMDVSPRDTAGSSPIARNINTIPVTVSSEVAPYARAVQEKISMSISYPPEAQRNGWQGTVKLIMVIKRDGTLRDSVIKDSSGYQMIDQDALKTAQLLAPYPAIPAQIKAEELAMTIPIVYSLRGEDKRADLK